MAKYFWNLQLYLVCFTIFIIPIQSVNAEEIPTIFVDDPIVDTEELPTPAVAELADVHPRDWNYQALQSLGERYGVFEGYPDRNFRGNRVLSRYQFAGVLNLVMNQINQQIAANIADKATREDLEILQRLQAEFAQELADVKGKVEKLEELFPATTEPFSLTTKFTGSVIFAVSGVGSGEKPNDEGEIDSNLTVGSRVRLNFDTSLTGKDRLRTRLQATNFPSINDAAGTDMASLSAQGSSNNRVSVSRLGYSFPVGEKIEVHLPIIGGNLRDFTDVLNPFLSSSSQGSISRFAQRNPIYRQGDGSGLGISTEISDTVNFDVGFVADRVNDPDVGFGKAAYAAIAQLTLEPADHVEVGFTYVHSYNSLDTGTGSQRANDPFDDESEAIVAHSFGIQSSIKLSSNLAASGWLGFTRATARDLPDNPTASIFNWAITLALPNLGSEGSLGGVIIGQPPKLLSNDFQVDAREYVDPDTSLHLETFYRWQVVDNIALTFGLLAITNPEHDRDRDTVYVGTMRTTFEF